MHEAWALVLDVSHRALLLRAPDETWHAPGTVARVGERPLEAIVAFARERLGMDLPSPSGTRPRADPRDFVFVLPPGDSFEPPDTLWVPMRELDAKTIHADVLWRAYAETLLGGWMPPTRDVRVRALGDGPRENAHLAHLVALGTKRAATGWIAADEAQGRALPTPGLVSIVTDGFGFPVCAIETEAVDSVAFGGVSEEHARLEAEGDGTLADWRARYRRAFEQRAGEVGIGFDEGALVFFERFRLLRAVGAPPSVRAGA